MTVWKMSHRNWSKQAKRKKSVFKWKIQNVRKTVHNRKIDGKHFLREMFNGFEIS